MAFPVAGFSQKTYTLTSPDGSLQTTVSAGAELTYDIAYKGRTLMEESPVSMTLADGRVWGPDAKVRKAERGGADVTVSSPFYRSSEIRDHYNSLTLRMRDGWSLEFRAYDDGIAYRFVSALEKPFRIASEQADYRFPEDYAVTVPYVKHNAGNIDAQWHNSFENTYTVTTLSIVDSGRLIFLPASVDTGDGIKICFTETDLDNYPGMYLWNGDGGRHLSARFAAYPKNLKQGGHNNLQMTVSEREDFIAEVDGPRTFPWRIAVVGTDVDLASSDLSYALAAPSKLSDISWIKPGKVAWEWWNAWNISGVDFRSGINTETYKYYIDFASERGIEYVILDEGWAVNLKADLMQVVPEIDLPEIVEYADKKGVGIILWAGYWAFERDMENVCRHYSEIGVKGFKVDFMDRDDQVMTGFNFRAAEMAAKYKLILDLHGTHKPAGLNRTWPNVLNFEGVHGLEQMKWSSESVDQVKYDVQIPFIRQVAGPMDYTQGAMRNASKGNYRPINTEPMSQGTRCRQLALYVVLDSPLNMLCDSPVNYMREEECTEFIASVPTVWDETRVIEGRMGEYIVMARRKGDCWYVGGLTDWTARDIEVDLSELGLTGCCMVKVFSDGINADRRASDYSLKTVRRDASEPLKIHLAPGGGFVAAAVPEQELTALSDKKDELSVFQLNIWGDATVVPGAFEALVDEIARLNADIVSLCEVSNHDGMTVDRLVEALKQRGQVWYGAGDKYTGVQGTDVCVLSRYPVTDVVTGISPVSGGADMKVRIDVDGIDVLVYPAHLDYTHYACYLPRGYDGVTWKQLPAPLADVKAVVKMNRESTRDEAMAAFVAEAASEKADLIILAGDFNEPSHLDWTESTAGLYDHRGCVVPWDCSVMLYEAGFRDVYRVIHPYPVTHPGFTYPSDNPDKEPKDLTWAPEADERDRIDFIYYLANDKCVPENAVVVGPSGSVVRCGRAEETGHDTFIRPLGVWPTDHKGVMATFRLVRK